MFFKVLSHTQLQEIKVFIDLISIKSQDNFDIKENKTTSKSEARPAKLSWKNLEFEVDIPLSKEEALLKGAATMKQRIIKGVSG